MGLVSCEMSNVGRGREGRRVQTQINVAICSMAIYKFTHAYLTSFFGAGGNFHNSLSCILRILVTYTVSYTYSDDVGGKWSHAIKNVGSSYQILSTENVLRDVIGVRMLYHIVEHWISHKRRVPLNGNGITCDDSHSQITNLQSVALYKHSDKCIG